MRQIAAPLVDGNPSLHHHRMDGHATNTPAATAHRNLHRLFLLRNFEIAAIGAGIVIATVFFDLALPLAPLLIILGLITLLNLFTFNRLHSGWRVSDRDIFIQTLLDVAGLTGIFICTGGAANPFVWFYLLPLMIAATILPRTHTWVMAVITVICYSSLFIVKIPPGFGHTQHQGGFQMHVFGMWLGFVMSAGFVAVIIVGMAHSLRERDRKLAEAREQALRNERLVALGTLATGAAHELGTPLGTMAILTSELTQEYTDPAYGALQKKLGILRSQIERCKQTLSGLSTSAGVGRAESGHRMAVKAYLEKVISEWRRQRPETTLETIFGIDPPACEIIAEHTLTQALVNILNNAAEASPQQVALQATWTPQELLLEITDRGPGLRSDIHGQLGKIPVTTKGEGLGIGLFLAHATIQRLGGSIEITQREQGGTRLHITLPLLCSKELQ
jgi:two-component system sensor histidine kinase RegB